MQKESFNRIHPSIFSTYPVQIQGGGGGGGGWSLSQLS